MAELSDDDLSVILEAHVQHFMRQGYRLTARGATCAQLIKPKEFSAVLAIVLFLLCLVPFFFYLLIFLGQKDSVIFIQVASSGKVSIAAA